MLPMLHKGDPDWRPISYSWWSAEINSLINFTRYFRVDKDLEELCNFFYRIVNGILWAYTSNDRTNKEGWIVWVYIYSTWVLLYETCISHPHDDSSSGQFWQTQRGDVCGVEKVTYGWSYIAR